MAKQTTWEEVAANAKKVASNEAAKSTMDGNVKATNAELDKISSGNKEQALSLYNQAKDSLNTSIKGGMSETTKSKLGTAYAKAVAADNSAKTTAKTSVSNTGAQAKAKATARSHAANANVDLAAAQGSRTRADRLANDKANRDQKLAMDKASREQREYINKTRRKNAKKMDKASRKQKNKFEKQKRKFAKQKTNLDVWKDTVGRFDSKKKGDNAIKRLKKSKDPLKSYKIAYIRSQIYKLDAEKKDKALSKELEKAGGGGGRGGGGGGYRRYGGYRRWGYGSGGSSSGTIEYKGNKDSSLTKEMNKYRAQNYKKMPSTQKGNSAKKESTWQKIKGALTGPAKVNNKTKQVYKKVAKPTKQSKGSVGRRNRGSQRRHWHL